MGWWGVTRNFSLSSFWYDLTGDIGYTSRIPDYINLFLSCENVNGREEICLMVLVNQKEEHITIEWID